MSIKYLLLLLPVIFAAQLCRAQRNSLAKAENHLNQFEYAAAANAYEQIIKANPSNIMVMEKLALCYEKLNNTDKSEHWLSKICSRENVDAKFLKQYAATLAANNKHALSITWYKKYSEQNPDATVKKIIAAFENLQQFYQDSSYYTIEVLPVNSEQSDFSPVFFRDGILFCSARTSAKGPKYAWDNSAFIDLYFTNDQQPPVRFHENINSSLHEGPATVTTGSDTLYFTRNSKTKNASGVLTLKIFYSVFKNGAWQRPTPFALNADAHSTGHPALAPNGKLYFVSDMPGGFGGTDLYWTQQINGHWSTPVNLGPKINTTGNEMFPFIDDKGDLYFASNLHAGLGGLDIFHAKANDEKFDNPVNMGYPVNSSKDDFGFIVRNRKGYFSSNRGHDSNDDNLYSVTIDKSKQLNFVAVDDGQTTLTDFVVQIIESDQAPKEVLVPNVLTSKFDTEKTYKVLCRKEGYAEITLALDKAEFRSFSNDQTITLTLPAISKNIALVAVSEDAKVLPHATFVIQNNATGTVNTLTSDDHGMVNVTLTGRDNVDIKVSKANHKTGVRTITAEESKLFSKDERVTITLLPTSALFDKKEIGQLIEMDIKYDVGKFNIRKDASKELDRLIAYLKKHPTLKVELGSHTDARGKDDANLALSQKRAAAAAHYVSSKGISSSRIIPVGYGETDLKLKDARTEDEHQQNRRTTVKVIGL
jgi:outer membrane protein OmpA-like peptidoglycan-associated protein/tetratricopeptide (TPR) repeat protein